MGNPKIVVRWNTEVEEFIGKESKLSTLRIINNQTEDRGELPVDGAFIFIGLDPNTGFLAGGGMKLDKWGFIVTGHELLHGGHIPDGYETREPYMLETSVPGVFAGGDCITGPNNVVEAMAAGLRAAESIDRYIQGQDLEVERSFEPPPTVEVDLETIEVSPYERAGMPVLRTGFIDTYIDGVLYPDRVAHLVQVLVGAIVLVSWAGLYLRWRGERRTTTHRMGGHAECRDRMA